MVVASFIVEQVHPIIRCDRAAIVIIVEVDEFGRSLEPGCQKLSNESYSGRGQLHHNHTRGGRLIITPVCHPRRKKLGSFESV